MLRPESLASRKGFAKKRGRHDSKPYNGRRCSAQKAMWWTLWQRPKRSCAMTGRISLHHRNAQNILPVAFLANRRIFTPNLKPAWEQKT